MSSEIFICYFQVGTTSSTAVDPLAALGKIANVSYFTFPNKLHRDFCGIETYDIYLATFLRAMEFGFTWMQHMLEVPVYVQSIGNTLTV